MISSERATELTWTSSTASNDEETTRCHIYVYKNRILSSEGIRPDRTSVARCESDFSITVIQSNSSFEVILSALTTRS